MVKRGQTVAFFWNKRWINDGKVMQLYPEFRDVIRVEKNGQEHLVLPDEVRSIDDHEYILEREKQRQAELDYADVITAWKAGKRTTKELADATHTSMQGISSRVRAAKRKGLI